MVAPDKVSKSDAGIATEIFAKVNALKDKAKEDGHPYTFEYVPEKDEYCFLTLKGYPDKEAINNDLQDLYKNYCEKLQKYHFSFEDQILILKHLKGVLEDKREKVLEASIIWHNGDKYSDSELDDALLCIQGISDEC